MNYEEFQERFFKLEAEVGKIEVRLHTLEQSEKKEDKKIHGYISEISIGYITKENIFIIQNKLKISGMSALSMNIGQTAVGTLAFTDAKGLSVPIANETVTTTSSDSTIATTAYDPSTGNVTITPVAAGTTTIGIDGKNADGTDVPFEDTTLTVGIAVDDATGGTVQWAVN
jgi:hypothetical protein